MAIFVELLAIAIQLYHMYNNRHMYEIINEPIQKKRERERFVHRH